MIVSFRRLHLSIFGNSIFNLFSYLLESLNRKKKADRIVKEWFLYDIVDSRRQSSIRTDSWNHVRIRTSDFSTYWISFWFDLDMNHRIQKILEPHSADAIAKFKISLSFPFGVCIGSECMRQLYFLCWLGQEVFTVVFWNETTTPLFNPQIVVLSKS